VRACLQTGKRVVLVGTTIEGALDLSAIDVVRQPFECRGCTLNGGLLASDVTFARTLDLSGARIVGRLDAAGAIFNGPVLFGAVPRPALLHGGADFSLAVFNDLATFAGASLQGEAAFTLAKFHGDASFAGAAFAKADFDNTSFSGPADFDASTFAQPSVFAGASFAARAGFREASFSSSASFLGSVFSGVADFTQAEFGGGATFDVAQFVSNASFLKATFMGTAPGLAASFVGTGASGDVDFSFASFQMPQPLSAVTGGGPAGTTSDGAAAAPDVVPLVASFFGLASAGTVSFRSAAFEPGYAIQMNDISAKGLVMTIGTAGSVADGPDDVTKEQQRHVLELIQASAKGRGDLGRANDAYFRLRTLVSRGYSWPHKYLLDIPFYRGIGGYLVEPLNPLLTLVALGAGFALLRTFGGRAAINRLWRALRHGQHLPRALWQRVWPTLRHPRRIPAATWNALRDTPSAFWQTFVRWWDHLLEFLVSIVWRTSSGAQPSLLRRTEVLVYRVLFAVFLIGLANSNPTLKQLIEAI
jgi:hypothetical protein